MKRYLIATLAIVLVLGISAFSEFNPSARDSFFWYDLSGGSLGFGAEPNNGCTASGTNCARGFISEPDDPTTEQPDETRAQN